MTRGNLGAAAAVLSYWTLLFALSLNLFGLRLPAPALPGLVACGLPLFVWAGRTLWREARSEINGLAFLDELTGVANRRAFMLEVRGLLEGSYPGSAALVLLDVDGLKQVNDSCGHLAGDELLRHAAAFLEGMDGKVFRIGGDEFAILVDRARGQNVTSVLRQLQPFRKLFGTCGHEHEVRISYGFASNARGSSTDSLFHAADDRLRDLKRQLYGKGRFPDRRAQALEMASPPLVAAEDAPPEADLPVSLDARRRKAALRHHGNF